MRSGEYKVHGVEEFSSGVLRRRNFGMGNVNGVSHLEKAENGRVFARSGVRTNFYLCSQFSLTRRSDDNGSGLWNEGGGEELRVSYSVCGKEIFFLLGQLQERV
jgi:hypothetical protein